MRQPIYLGDLEFRSKKELEDFIRSRIRDLGSCEVRADSKDYNLFHEVLKRHYEYDEKVGVGIDYFYIQPNFLSPSTFQTRIKRKDGSDIDFSWVKCCRLRFNTDKDNLESAMRDAVKRDTIAFKKNYFQSVPMGTVKCSICNVVGLDYNNYETDHITPSFKEIKLDFLNNTNLSIPTVFSDCPKSCKAIFRSEDEVFEKNWYEFHKKKASYQILCNKCNGRKQ